MEKMNTVDWIAYVLVMIGALNWGFMTFDVNLLGWLNMAIQKTIYALVGLSAVWMIVKAFRK